MQNIVCNIDSLRELPHIINKSVEELKNNYLNASASEKINSDSFLLQYTLKNPDSYVALWKLIAKFSDGYEIIYDSIYNHFSDAVKHTYTGLALAKNLNTSSVTAIGKYFPVINLVNVQNKNLAITFNSKYTLVDFWFSHCNPCISQFNELKMIYGKYSRKNFEIISISTDETKDINTWKSVIKKYALPWKQLLDKDGIDADRFSINKFPTNFLIDKDGKIIAKDIELPKLDSLLMQNSATLH